MERSWLVQRVKAPTDRPNPFAFGGGYKNGGLSDDAFDIVRQVMSFDYMGAAEFEFGEVPKAFQKMAACTTGKLRKKSGLVTFTIGSYSKPIYVLAQPDQEREITERITAWAEVEYQDRYSEFRTKETVYLHRALNEGWERDYNEITGWLELNNGYFFSVDADMFKNVCAIFGVEVES